MRKFPEIEKKKVTEKRVNFNGSKNHRSTYLSSRVLPSVLQKIFHQDRKSSADKPRTTKKETEENITRIEVIHENLLLPFSCRQRIDPSFTNEASSLATVTAGKHRSITGPVTNITRRYTSRYYNLHADPPSSSLSLSTIHQLKIKHILSYYKMLEKSN